MSNFNPKPKLPKQDKTIISIRISYETLEKLDKVSASLQMSRNEFVIQCIDYALSNMDKK